MTRLGGSMSRYALVEQDHHRTGQDNLDGLEAARVTYWNQTHASVLVDC